jgi:hypothetical protein
VGYVMNITKTDRKVLSFVVALTLLVLIPGLVLVGAVGVDVGKYPVIASLSWLVGGLMTWGYGKYNDYRLLQAKQALNER